MYIYTSRDFCKFYRHRVAADEMSFYAFGGILLCWQAEPSLAPLFAVASKFHVRTAVYNRGTLGPAFFVLLRYPLFSLWKSIWRGSHSWYICYVNFGDTKKKKKKVWQNFKNETVTDTSAVLHMGKCYSYPMLDQWNMWNTMAVRIFFFLLFCFSI